MRKEELKDIIDRVHAEGKRAAVCFCSHVPAEITEAAGFALIRVPYIEDAANAAGSILPSNVCPIVKNTCDVLEDDCLENADLIIAETSCDGKRKLYELASRKERMYFYQVPQGEDRHYAQPLIKKECYYLREELQKRFGLAISDDAVRAAGELMNRERESVLSLMEIQKDVPPASYGMPVFEALMNSRKLPDPSGRASANAAAREQLLSSPSPVPEGAPRILITGCPMNGIYRSVISAVEDNGGVVVCFENCDAMKPAIRRFDTEQEDVLEALADCYLRTACAIMSPDVVRFDLIRRLVSEYRVDGILDITMPACHPYTVEVDRMKRLARELDVPYMALQKEITDIDAGQLGTRVAAFLEML